MAEEELNIEEEAIALEDSSDAELTDYGVDNLVDHVMAQFKKSEDYRYEDEQRWIRAYRNYRGLYGPDVQFTEAEKSRVFIKITKTKVLAAYGQLSDILFSNKKFPIVVEPTPVPEGIAEFAHEKTPIDERLFTRDNKIKDINAVIYDCPVWGFSDWISKHNKYSDLEANLIHERFHRTWKISNKEAFNIWVECCCSNTSENQKNKIYQSGTARALSYTKKIKKIIYPERVFE